MIDPRAKYQDALAAFAAPGGRWANKGALTYWGKAAGLSADEIIADVRAAGVTDRDADIRRGWADAQTRDLPNLPNMPNYQTPRARKPAPPPTHAGHVRNLIAAGGGMGGCDFNAVRDVSPCWDFVGKGNREQTALFIRAAFATNERLHVFRDDAPPPGKPGVNIRTAAEWVQAIERGETLPGDLVVPNPFTGEIGTTTAGKQSFIAQRCLAAFPFMVVEFDDAKFAFGGDAAKGLALQCAFWRGFILKSELAPALLELTYSGGKSIHALLHVGAANLEAWNAARARLIALFASDAECVADADGKRRFPFRIDDQALRPRQGTRIPGVVRFDNHRAQEILYLNPLARQGTMWHDAIANPPPIDPNGKPPCGSAVGTGMCGVCENLRRCPFADPDAVPGTTLKGGAKC